MFNIKRKIIIQDLRDTLSDVRGILKDPDLRNEIGELFLEIRALGKLIGNEINILEAKDRAERRLKERTMFHNDHCPDCGGREVSLEGAKQTKYGNTYGTYSCNSCGCSLQLTPQDYKILGYSLPAMEE